MLVLNLGLDRVIGDHRRCGWLMRGNRSVTEALISIWLLGSKFLEQLVPLLRILVSLLHLSFILLCAVGTLGSFK